MTCKICKHFNPVKDNGKHTGFGVCKRNPPQVIAFVLPPKIAGAPAQINTPTVWPMLAETEGCGAAELVLNG